MGRRVSRLTMRKSSTKNKARNKTEDDDLGGEPNAPTDAQWNQMHTHGTFCIIDSEGRNLFRQGQIAAILPEGNVPSQRLEPHEYWVGRILEIRSDGSSSDSNVIWSKVQWFYSAQDALPYLPSLDVSSIGQFERLHSNHWDYVLPHTFNHLVPMTKLYTFPRNDKDKKTRVKAKRRTTATPLTESGTPDKEPVFESQTPIAPNAFYYRYSLDFQNNTVVPIPDHGICICSKSYRPEEDSALTGVMHMCPRPSCNTGYHLKCLQSINSVWDGQGVIVPTLPPKGKGKRKAKTTTTTTPKKKGMGKGKGKQRNKSMIEPLTTTINQLQITDEIVMEDYTGLTPRQIRLLSSSPETDNDVNLMDLFIQGKGHTQHILHILERYYHNYLSKNNATFSTISNAQHNQPSQSESQQIRGLGGEPPNRRRRIISANEGHHTRSSSLESINEVEDLLIGSENDSFEDFPSTHDTQAARAESEEILNHEESTFLIRTRAFTSKETEIEPKAKSTNTNITPAILLYTLFIVPILTEMDGSTSLESPMFKHSPFSSSPSPPTSLSPSTEPFTSTQLHSPIDNKMGADEDSVHEHEEEYEDEEYELEGTPEPKPTSLSLLLSLATQPLIRGGGYYPYLGPTGNVNVVIKARKMVWDGLKFVGDFQLSSECIQSLDEGEYGNVEMGWKEIRSSLETFLNGWREKLENDRDVLAEDCEIEDAIISIHNQDNSKSKSDSMAGVEGVSIKNEEEEEGSELLRVKTKKRKLSKYQETNGMTDPRVFHHKSHDLKQMGERELLKVDWVCPGCNGTI